MEHLLKHENANLRIMTSNILFDDTAPMRYEKLLENYDYYQPDAIGFQEVNKFYYDNLMTRLEKMGYKLASAWPDAEKRRQSEIDSLSKKYPSINFVPIAYRADRFEEVESYYMMYTSTWTYTKGLTAVVLREKASGKLIAVLNTHAALYLTHYNIEGGSDAVYGTKWRADNARQIIEERDALKAKYGDIPFFFTGDFNGGEEEAFYKTIINGGMVNTKYAAKASASLGQFSYHAVVGQLPDDKRSPIDHVFASLNVDVWVHSIERRQEVLDASDHCMVFADVTI